MDKSIKRVLSSETIKTSGVIDVSSGGVIAHTCITSDGQLNVLSGGICKNITNSSGNIVVSSGGTANNVKDLNSGTSILNSGSLSNFAGYNLDGVSINGGDVFISSGASANNAVVDSGNFVIKDFGFASNTILSGGTNGSNTANGHMIVSGSAENVYVYPERDFFVRSNGNASNVFMSGGSGIVGAGGTVSNVSVKPSGYIRISGAVESALVQGAGHLFIDGSGNNLSAIGSGDIFVGTTATATNIYLSSGRMSVAGNVSNVNDDYVNNYISVGSGGILKATQTKGLLVASNGGIISSATVLSGGRIQIQNNGSGSNITVSSNGSVTISSGGSIYNGTVANNENPGKITLLSGAVGTNLTGGAPVNSQVFVSEGANLSINNEYTANRIVNEGTVVVTGYGKIQNTIIQETGGAYLYNGGYAENIIVVNNDKTKYPFISIYSGTKITSSIAGVNGHITAVGGTVEHCSADGEDSYLAEADGSYPTNRLNACICSNGGRINVRNSATNLIAGSGGVIYQLSGVCVNPTINSSGYLSIVGGVCSNADINAKGNCGVHSNGIVNSASIIGNGVAADYPILRTQNGGIATDLFVYNHAEAQAYTSGILSNVTLNNGGRLLVYPNGSAYSITVNSGGSAYFMSGGNAGIIQNTSVTSGGKINCSGGTLSSATIDKGGTATVTNCQATNIKENGGAVIINAGTASFYGNAVSNLSLDGGNSATVHSGTVFSKATINNGSATVYSGGKISSCTVSNGSVVVNAGGSVTFPTIQNNGLVSVMAQAHCNNITMSGGSMIADQNSYISSLQYLGGTLNQKTDILWLHVGKNKSHTASNGLNECDIYGTVTLVNGGKMSNTLYNNGSGTCIHSGGFLTISSGASAINVRNYGAISVSNGGYYAINENTYSVDFGNLNVFNGGSAYINPPNAVKTLSISVNPQTFVKVGEEIVVSAGKYLKDTIGSLYKIWMTAQGSFQQKQVSITSGGTLTMNTGAYATNVIVSSGGSLHLASQGQISNLQTMPGAIVTIG